jgi:CheY-like chemotaxis protein
MAISLLYVEDDDSTRYAIARYLRAGGFDVDEFSESSLSIERLRSRHYDAMLVDLKLGGGDRGSRVLEFSRNMPPQTRPLTVVVTGNREMLNDGSVEGVNLVVFKPVDPEFIRAWVTSTLENSPHA